MIHQILLALNFMHGKNIMHRDLKPENILCEDFLDADIDELHVKIADFGLATRYEPEVMRFDGCGSLEFQSPEMCRNDAYNEKVDIWAVGVMTYLMLGF